ncbi:hypothetical protein FSB08_14120 [Paraburkholderia sp. JPY432]|uniref:hypothetical protein n=1 Tax=Paraburkholderia youngii TaxID=2782701 RepID=UPI001595D2BD|nr:hypothetical protein [Paraburkholderia youngii]NVH73672.1 hypothetical protein [Paraburkholderia youngii]
MSHLINAACKSAQRLDQRLSQPGPNAALFYLGPGQSFASDECLPASDEIFGNLPTHRYRAPEPVRPSHFHRPPIVAKEKSFVSCELGGAEWMRLLQILDVLSPLQLRIKESSRSGGPISWSIGQAVVLRPSSVLVGL